MGWDDRCSIEVLKGKTLKSVTNNGDEVLFETVEGEQFKMYHSQDCCESVSVEDVIGDLNDLLDSPIVEAEEVTNPEGFEAQPNSDESFTWTFYKLGTAKGSVTIRWYGTSNGYYSESVDFEKVTH